MLTAAVDGHDGALIRQIMQFIQQFILGFLYVCGPIAMMPVGGAILRRSWP